MTTTTPLPTRLRRWAETSADEYRARVLRAAADELERLASDRANLLALLITDSGELLSFHRYSVSIKLPRSFPTYQAALTYALRQGEHERRNREQVEMARREMSGDGESGIGNRGSER